MGFNLAFKGLTTPQNNSASWGLQMEFNAVFNLYPANVENMVSS